MGLFAFALGNPVLALGGIAVVAVGCMAVYTYVYHDGYVDGKLVVQNKWDVAEEGRRVANSVASVKLSQDLTKIKVKNAKKLSDIIARRDAEFERLRKRAEERLPPDSRARCEGSTGSELSRPDAAFLTGFAASAAAVQSGLAACYDELDVIRNRLGQANER